MQVPDRVAPIVDFIFPPRCPLCGAAVARQGGLCAACWPTLAIPSEPSCPGCGRPFAGAAAPGTRCAPCLAQPPAHDGIVAATLYNAAARRLVIAFKHGRRIALAPLLGRLISARLTASRSLGAGEPWLVVPVPIHRWRLWHRGFNQSALLARDIAARIGGELIVDAMVRRRATPILGGLGRTARERALRGAIALKAGTAARIRGASVLLVDDVLTSGATSNACVRALKRAGAKTVVIACFARVLDEALPPDRA
ncbi:ComF family protein [Novosphingobium aerophilum]|uniref:ComF family protein n=1 Tax=Novosphingobium aerophilum TaxID=2839843 RepID=A0A7X1F7Z9_9SPHN|nr:ComF family protein [Novosphingobium aerophilum]MBC2652105.1 ComF family protein [Novosphingobium aerophilum]